LNRIISFCLFGDQPMYLTGAVENARLCKEIFPGWTSRFYVSEEVPRAVIEALVAHGAEVVINERRHCYDATFWRFYPAGEPDLDALMVRDTDSRLGERDHFVVEEWLKSGKGLHIIRDHPNHIAPIMAGMWGCRGGVLGDIDDRISHWIHLHAGDRYGSLEARNAGQVFLFEMVYRELSRDALIHSEFVRFQGELARPIYAPRKRNEFIGQIFDEHGVTRKDHIEDLEQAMKLGPNRFTLRHVTR